MRYKHIYHNENPQKRTVGDCVIRAIAKATDKSWVEVYQTLFDRAIKSADIATCKTCFEPALIEDFNFTRHKMPVHRDKKKYTVEEFGKKLAEKNHAYVLQVANHLTCIVCDDIHAIMYDLWDCSKKSVYNYYSIELKK